MPSATTNGTPHLENLLTRFGVENLGEGDTVAGANLLAAMACSVANIQRPGSGFMTGDGETIAVGTSQCWPGAPKNTESTKDSNPRPPLCDLCVLCG